MIVELWHYLAGVLMVIGAGFTLIAAIGVLRLPDLYTRMHAASKAGPLGCGILLLTIAMVSLDSSVTLRALVGFLFLLLTAPVSAHLLARAAYKAGYRPADATVLDELRTPPAE